MSSRDKPAEDVTKYGIDGHFNTAYLISRILTTALFSHRLEKSSAA